MKTMTGKHISRSGKWINTSVGSRYTMKCLSNRSRRIIQLRLIHPREVFFPARTPSVTTAWSADGHAAAKRRGSLDPFGSMIITTWKGKGNTVFWVKIKPVTMRVLLTGKAYLHTVSTHISMLLYTLASTQEDYENDFGSLFSITIYKFIFSNL